MLLDHNLDPKNKLSLDSGVTLETTSKVYENHVLLSADSISSALLVRLREEGRRRKEEGGGLFSNSLVELEELKVWEC